MMRYYRPRYGRSWFDPYYTTPIVIRTEVPQAAPPAPQQQIPPEYIVRKSKNNTYLLIALVLVFMFAMFMMYNKKN